MKQRKKRCGKQEQTIHAPSKSETDAPVWTKFVAMIVTRVAAIEVEAEAVVVVVAGDLMTLCHQDQGTVVGVPVEA